jgi:mono/diheme cytochrome c family protein
MRAVRPLLGLGFTLSLLGGLLVLAVAFPLTVAAEGSSAPRLHGTPDPNATPHYHDGAGASLYEELPTYYGVVGAILAQNCVNCHVEGTIGAEYLLLDSPEQAQRSAEDIAFTASIRYMPPWMPSELSPPFRHDRSLSEAEIDVLVTWAENGAPLGDPQTANVDLLPPAPLTVRPDVVLTMEEPYTPDPTRFDDYRCFLIDPQLEEARFVVGQTVIPGQPSLVHHVVVYPFDESQRAEAEAADAADEGLGWECFGGPGISINGGPDFALGGWAPGAPPVIHDDGTGYLLTPETLVIMQVHYNMTAPTAPDQTQMLLELAPPGADLRPLSSMTLVAPVEIPCPPEYSERPECNRTWVLKQLAAEENATYEQARRWQERFLAICGHDEDDFIHQDASAVTSDCTRPIREEALAVGVMGHMHVRGVSLRVTLNAGRPDEQILLDIPDWDFHWQGSYQFETPIAVKAGDSLKIQCVWDNSRTPNPRYMFWGEGTDDEMCLGAVIFAPLP